MQTRWKQFEEMSFAMTAAERQWLNYAGSLTKRLRQTNPNIEHHIQCETWGIPRVEESLRLGIATTEIARIRETDWRYHGTQWVTTRTIIPAATMQGQGECLQQLADLSLGDLLFADPSLQRSTFEFTQLVMQQENCWARRSIFYYFGQPLLVNEIFFPTIFNIDPASHD